MGISNKFWSVVFLVGGFLVAAVGYFALSLGSDKTEAADIAVGPAGERIVIVTDKGYKPQTTEIKAGTSVKWVNGGQETHTVTFGLNSSIENLSRVDQKLNPKESLTYKFEKVGKFSYFDRDDNFTGTVEVK